MTARSSKCSVIAALLSMLVPKPQFHTNPNFAHKFFFLSDFCPKTTEPIRFLKSCMKNQLKLIIPKRCGFWSKKGSNI